MQDLEFWRLEKEKQLERKIIINTLLSISSFNFKTIRYQSAVTNVIFSQNWSTRKFLSGFNTLVEHLSFRSFCLFKQCLFKRYEVIYTKNSLRTTIFVYIEWNWSLVSQFLKAFNFPNLLKISKSLFCFHNLLINLRRSYLELPVPFLWFSLLMDVFYR